MSPLLSFHLRFINLPTLLALKCKSLKIRRKFSVSKREQCKQTILDLPPFIWNVLNFVRNLFLLLRQCDSEFIAYKLTVPGGGT